MRRDEYVQPDGRTGPPPRPPRSPRQVANDREMLYTLAVIGLLVVAFVGGLVVKDRRYNSAAEVAKRKGEAAAQQAHRALLERYVDRRRPGLVAAAAKGGCTLAINAVDTNRIEVTLRSPVLLPRLEGDEVASITAKTLSDAPPGTHIVVRVVSRGDQELGSCSVWNMSRRGH